MKNADIKDVVIIYSENIARSASSHFVTPFPTNPQYLPYNTAYSYFLEYCNINGISAALSTSADIIGPAACQSYWEFDGYWKKVSRKCTTKNTFVKFFPKNKEQLYQRELYLSDKNINALVSDALYELFLDKMNIYLEFPNSAIPTVPVKSSKSEDIQNAIDTLMTLTANHDNSEDFSDHIILKDRFGFGGNDIFKIEDRYVEKIKKVLKKYSQSSFVLQPFVHFDKGTPYKTSKTAADIRFIYFGSKLVQTYFRFPKKGDFRCNQDQGGTLVHVDELQIPEGVYSFAKNIIDQLPDNNSLFAIDFMMSNSGNIYLLEGNSHPGLNWMPSDKIEEEKTKHLIHLIVDEFQKRLHDDIKPLIRVPQNMGVPIKI